ncbi:S8 family serine peptidase [Streptomyces sp. NBC_01341]|uniref:S8 family serine peptidase n=1 Tax=Streptomyces sp. NBC_01341 TaxID=2903831 RepID=UPI002E14B4BF|nr:S8 family serine peptidase [Streptomyces sp. NBC_01341]
MTRLRLRRRMYTSAPTRFSTVALTALLSVPALAAAGPASAASPSDSTRLLVMPSELTDGQGCTGPSDKKAAALPWAQQSLGLARTWAVTQGGGVTVAVVDTGVSQKAPALHGRVTSVGSGGTDCVGHGTFVAGLIAAGPAKGVRFAGTAPGARLIGVRGTDERGAATGATVAAGINSAVDAGADVIEVSPAVVQRSGELRAAVSRAVKKDVLIVAAAVPDAPQRTSSEAPVPRDYWPAAEPEVLSVVDIDAGGTRPDDALLPRSADMAAPGDGVVGIGPGGKGHFIGSGASLAAAYVAGTAALVRSMHPGLSAQATAEVLVATAYPADVPRVDPYAAVTSVRGGAALPQVATGSGPVHLPSDGDAGRATGRAVALAAGGAGVALLAAWGAVIVPRGRARRWRAPAR